MKQKSSSTFFINAAPLFLVLFIDGMGLGLVFPILNALIMDPANSILTSDISQAVRSFIFGSIISTFMFCWFFGAAFLGDLSDVIGRKKSLMICLIGAFLGYFLSALAVILSSISLLVAGRIIAGLTAGSQSIAQAAIIDLSTPEEKTRNIGLILFFLSLGFIFGPLVGGFLSDDHLVSWFTFSTPLYFTAIISALNAFLLWTLFHETFVKAKNVTKIKFHRAIEIFISAFKNIEVGKLSIIFLVMMIGWSNYYTFISMFLFKQFNFTPEKIAIFMSLLAMGFGIGSSFLINYFTKRFTLKKTVILCTSLAAFCALVTVTTDESLYAWLTIAPLGAGISVAYSVMLTVFSNQVDSNKQGWVMGITGSIMAFAFGTTALISGVIADFSVRIPILISGIGLLLSAMLLALHKQMKSVASS